jgi:hypothetical protein
VAEEPDGQPADSPGSRAELFGRGGVLRFVADALDRSRNRETPPVMRLIGPRGSGKTVVINALRQITARSRSARRCSAPAAPVQLSAVYTGKHPQGSNPVGKVIPILALTPDGQARFRHLGQAAIIPPGS